MALLPHSQSKRNIRRSQNRIESYHQLRAAVARVTGSVERLEKLLDRCGWKVEQCPDEAILFRLMATRAFKNKNESQGPV